MSSELKETIDTRPPQENGKRRLCACYPDKIYLCSKANNCPFAHQASELSVPTFTNKEEFSGDGMVYMEKYKTLWCPYGVSHDWHQCMYAHTYQDFRRTPLIGYGSEPCPYWQGNNVKDYLQRCPWGFRCPFAHGSKEQLYHPSYYKTNPCSDYKSRKACPRAHFCTFYHDTEERRVTELSSGGENLDPLPDYPDYSKVDYTVPLDEAVVLSHLMKLQPQFAQPPQFAAAKIKSSDSGMPSQSSVSSGGDASFDMSYGVNLNFHHMYGSKNTWWDEAAAQDFTYPWIGRSSGSYSSAGHNGYDSSQSRGSGLPPAGKSRRGYVSSSTLDNQPSEKSFSSSSKSGKFNSNKHIPSHSVANSSAGLPPLHPRGHVIEGSPMNHDRSSWRHLYGNCVYED